VVCVNTQPNLHSRVRARCRSILPARPSVSAANNRNLDAVHQHIHLWNVLFRNHGQDELFGTTDFLLVPLGDLVANGLGGAFDGFGRNIQAGEQFRGLAPRSESHLTAHHGLHASHAPGRIPDRQHPVRRQPGTVLSSNGYTRNKGASVRPTPARSARSSSAIPCSGRSVRRDRESSGGPHLADRIAASTACRSSRP
jgi:hypothetical protein